MKDIGAASRAAFARLIDYAGLFPPAELAMDASIEEYAAARHGAVAWMLGRFIVTATRAAEAAALWETRGGTERLGLSVILNSPPDPRSWLGSLQQHLETVAAPNERSIRLPVEAIEVPLPAPLSARETLEAPIAQLRAALDRAGLRDLPAFAELPTGPRWSELLPGAMTALKRARLGAKIRCGGVVAEAFPSVDVVAGFISAAAAEDIAYKATAGLHHPVRHRDDASGFVMHGFLNLLAAAVFAPHVTPDELRRIVAEEDPAAFAFDRSTIRWRDRSAGVADIERMRAHAFVGYGSCSFSEPVEDLTALGMLPAALA